MNSRRKKLVDPLTALRELVDACEYVRPFAGAVCVEPTVKNIREAGKFVGAMDQAKAVLEKSKKSDE